MLSRPLNLARIVALLTPIACGDGRDGDPFGTAGSQAATTEGSSAGEGPTGETADPTAGSTSSSSSSGQSDTDDGGGIKFDTPPGGGTATGGDGTTGCKKIDFLFIIDNSGSMAAHQQNLLANFGPFMDTIAATVQGKDYHVMVLDSDACPTMGGSCTPTTCEDTLGAGQVRNCPVPGGIRYLSSDLDLATLKSTFQCIASVGVQGSAEEMPLTAMVQAIGPLQVPGQCNEGFLRDDAILVVTMISDDHSGWFGNDNENGYGGTPQSWYDAVIAAKGKPENVVVLGLIALLSDQGCIGFGPKEADQFKAFVEMFGNHGIVGSVCTPDYNAFFQDAVALIDTTCDDFMPEG